MPVPLTSRLTGSASVLVTSELHVDLGLALGVIEALHRDEAGHHAAGLRRQGHAHARLALRVGLDELAEDDLLLALADDLLRGRILVGAAGLGATSKIAVSESSRSVVPVPEGRVARILPTSARPPCRATSV